MDLPNRKIPKVNSSISVPLEFEKKKNELGCTWTYLIGRGIKAVEGETNFAEENKKMAENIARMQGRMQSMFAEMEELKKNKI